AAGGELVGSVEVSGNAFASIDDVREDALNEAASSGGTHVFIVDENAYTSWLRVSNDQITTARTGNSTTTTFQPAAAIPFKKFTGNYMIVRVSAENWASLPAVLQPRANRYAASRITYDAAGYPIARSPKAEKKDLLKQRDESRHCQIRDDNSRCFRSQQACEYADPAISCKIASSAFCFSARGRTDWCYATPAACDEARNREGVTSECTD
ncbi:MAG: hypothetical protein ABI867_39100, partial [Kofleriaceae bacterium]